MDQLVEERTSHTYAEPLSGLQVSWGAVLAGAVGILAIALILMALALAVIMSSTNVTVGSMKGSAIAIFICAIVVTLLAAPIGGIIAGYLPGNPRRALGAAHGFLAWAVAFLIAATTQWYAITGMSRAATNAVVTTASTAVQTAGATVGSLAGGVAGSSTPMQAKAMSVLTSLGYSQAEAARMVGQAQSSVQKALRGKEPAAAQGGMGTTAQQVRGTANTVIDWTAGLAWAWFGTWVLAAGLAVAGGAFATRRIDRGLRTGRGMPYRTVEPAPRGMPTEPGPTPLGTT